MEYSRFIEEREKFVPVIGDYLESFVETENVGKIKWEAVLNTPQEYKISNKYNGMSLKDFIALYKIDRLEKLNVISDIIAQDLRDLLFLKIELGEKIGEYALSDNKENNLKVKKLLSKIIKIENVFARYHLLEKVDLKDIIDKSIAYENYGNLRENVNMQAQIYDEIASVEGKDDERTILYLNALLDKKDAINSINEKDEIKRR